jgi:hypothetical protein
MANRTDNLFAAITREVAAREEAFAAEERLSKRRAQIAAEVVRVEARREAERAEIIRRAGEDRAALERERAAEVAAIQRRFQRIMTDAVAERDALAAHQARNAAEDQLAAAEAAAQLDLARLHTALDRQSRALDSHYAERIAVLMASTRREEAEVTAAASRAERARLAVTQIGGAWREQQEAAHQSNLSSILNFGLSIAESRWQQFMTAILRAIPGGTVGTSGNVNLTVNATAPAAIRQQVDSRLNEYFRRAGYTEY